MGSRGRVLAIFVKNRVFFGAIARQKNWKTGFSVCGYGSKNLWNYDTLYFPADFGSLFGVSTPLPKPNPPENSQNFWSHSQGFFDFAIFGNRPKTRKSVVFLHSDHFCEIVKIDIKCIYTIIIITLFIS